MALAIFTTWTTYGTWLPGDERNWFKPGVGIMPPDDQLRSFAQSLMTETAVTLNDTQRTIVEATIRENCAFRRWELLAVNCRTNHVHVVVSCGEIEIVVPRETFKAWSTRRLKHTDPRRSNWWTDRGWDVYIDEQTHLENAIQYVLEGQ